VTVSNRISYVF